MEIKSLECPKCGAPIQLPEGTGATYTCPFCQNSIAIPKELRNDASRPAPGQADGQVFAGMPALNDLGRMAEVKRLSQSGQKIEAIKLLRELTGLGLAEAKSMVDKMELGQPVVLSSTSARQSTFTTASSSSSQDMLAEIRPLLASGNKIEAIRVVRERTGLGLAEAKKLVETIEAGGSINSVEVQSTTTSTGVSGISVNTALESAIRTLTSRGQKIEAIKMLRQTNDLSLTEAKAAVEAVERGETLDQALGSASLQADRQILIGQMDQRMNQPGSKSGSGARRAASCGGCFLVLFILFFAVGIPLAAIIFTTDNPVRSLFDKINPLAYAQVVTRFGSEGTGQGYFNDPRSIAIDGKGYVYVADYGDGRIQRFDSQGNFLNLWTIPPPETSNNVYITSMAADHDGKVFVSVGGEIVVFDGAQGKEVGRVVIDEPGGDGPIYAEDIFMTTDNRLGVVYSGESVVLADQSGAVSLSIPNAMSKVTKDSELDGKIAVDGSGSLYLLGSFNNAVVKYTQDGTYTTRFGGDGDQPGQFSAVDAIAVGPTGQIFVSDIHGIQVFDADGRFVRQFDIGAVAFGMTFDAQGNLWVATNHSQVTEYRLQSASK